MRVMWVERVISVPRDPIILCVSSVSIQPFLALVECENKVIRARRMRSDDHTLCNIVGSDFEDKCFFFSFKK